MTRKEMFEKSMSEYFPQLSLRAGNLNEYANIEVQLAWFFYEEGRNDEARKTFHPSQKEPVATENGWKVELPPNIDDWSLLK